MPPRQRTRLTVMLLLIFAPAGVRAQADPLAGLDAYLEQAVREWGVAGLSIAIVKDDSVVYARGFGVRQAGRPERVDERTLFAIGSNSKAFTAAAVGMLVDARRLGLDDRVSTHLPSFQLQDPYVTRELTVRDLLTHRVGLPRGDGLWRGSGYDRREILERARGIEPVSSFRTQYGYQNIMFLAAGEIVSVVSGMSWDDFIRDRFFAPLGMRESSTTIRAFAAQSNVAQPHVYVDGRATAVPYRDIDNIGPAGSINSNALEMAQWLRLLLGGGEYRGQRLLSEGFVREMMRPQIFTGGLPTRASQYAAYGLGIAVRDYHGNRLVSHTGGIDGMASAVSLLPDHGLGVVVLTNTAGQQLYTQIPTYIIDAYLGLPRRDLSAIALEQFRQTRERADSANAAAATARAADSRPSLPLARYAGSYESRLYGGATVTLDGDALVLRRGIQTGRLIHWQFDTFRVTWSGLGEGAAFVTFGVDAGGNVARMDIGGLGEYRRQ